MRCGGCEFEPHQEHFLFPGDLFALVNRDYLNNYIYIYCLCFADEFVISYRNGLLLDWYSNENSMLCSYRKRRVPICISCIMPLLNSTFGLKLYLLMYHCFKSFAGWYPACATSSSHSIPWFTYSRFRLSLKSIFICRAVSWHSGPTINVKREPARYQIQHLSS